MDDSESPAHGKTAATEEGVPSANGSSDVIESGESTLPTDDSIDRPSASEREAVEQLRIILDADPEATTVPYRFTDTALLRFYRGRKGDIEKAHRALVKHLQWRVENEVESITDEDIAVEFDQGKLNVVGFDKHRRPCVFIYARKHNRDKRDLSIIKKYMIKTIGEDTMRLTLNGSGGWEMQMVAYCIRMAIQAHFPLFVSVLLCAACVPERTVALTRPEEERLVIVFDLSGFSLQCMDFDAVKLLVDILQWNYPETLSVALIVNAPFIFSACWTVIKLWLDPVTSRKVAFVSSAALSEYLDPSTLPDGVI